MTAAGIETLCFRITGRCNLSCWFCRAGSSPANREHGDVEAFKRFVSDMQDHLGLRHVSVSGGEPGLDRRLDALVRWMLERGLHVSVTTNGTTRLSIRLAGLGREYPHRIRLRVSVDGDQRLHDQIRGSGKHSLALEEVHRIHQEFGWVAINTVATRDFLERGLTAEDVFGSRFISEWALITPVPQGSAAGHHWQPDDTLPRIARLREAVQAAGFAGRIVIWNFLGTPNTSVLVDASNRILLAGIGEADHQLLGSLDRYTLGSIRDGVARARKENSRTHFAWTSWE